MIDKQKHANEFRLRILLTNKCDKKCFTCLNEFQSKGIDFISPIFVKKYVYEYVQLCKSKKVYPIISLSGGEPGLHPEFGLILEEAKNSGAKIQVNTNGLVDDVICDLDGVDVRYHMGHGLRNKIIPGQTAIFVLSELYSVIDNINFIKPFYDGGMKIKVFVEYYSTEYFKSNIYPQMMAILNDFFPVSGRFTGIQENRGKGCWNCKKICITLKALWLFPNNTSSFCPQRLGNNSEDVKATLLTAYNNHLVINNN